MTRVLVVVGRAASTGSPSSRIPWPCSESCRRDRVGSPTSVMLTKATLCSIKHPKLQPKRVLIPPIAGQRPSVADIQVAPLFHLGVTADLHVHDRVAAR